MPFRHRLVHYICTLNRETAILTHLLPHRALKARIAAMRPRLYRLAYAWSHNPALADDLAQETVIKGLKALHQLKDENLLEAWLFCILNNCWRDHFRRQHPQADLEEIAELPSSAATPEEVHTENELVRRVRRAVAALPLSQRAVVTLIDLEELSYSEAATALAIPIGTVMSRLHRARHSLRDLLQEMPASVHVLNTKSRNGQ